MSATPFHAAVDLWLQRTHGQPSEPQRLGWPEIWAGHHTLIAAPTGTGKTLAGFLSAIDGLIRAGLTQPLADETRVLYVSPLKALGNDIEKNLQEPLRGIQGCLQQLDLPPVELRSAVRSGDTPASERQRQLKRPPHILVTTPESLYLLLTSEGGRRVLRTVQTVIVDEIHALLPNRRGAHLSLSLERLQELATSPLQRIGLSATQKPIEEVARFLVGAPPQGKPPLHCATVNCGHQRTMQLQLELPPSPLEAVMSAEVWSELYDRLAELAQQNTTTLIFVGNRRLAERLCRHLAERLEDPSASSNQDSCVAAHHGSLAKDIRLRAETRLKTGKLRALVATASLELGIDIGSVDLVCQIGSPRSIASLLQRVGRAGHHYGGIPQGRLFPLSRNDLLECAALLQCIQLGELDAAVAPDAPLDILAQQIVAMCACSDWHVDALFQIIRRSHCYRNLTREAFEAVLAMLANGFDTQRGRRAALIRHDPITHMVQGRKAARLVAVTSGGAIADSTDYRVILEPEETHIGSIGEDFAVESMAGDIFQLGNASWQILKVETGVVRVADAHGQPPTIPFWLGEAPARTDELSHAVSRLKERVEGLLLELDGSAVPESLVTQLTPSLGKPGSEQLVDYLVAAQRTLTAMPTQDRIVVERFFDEAQNTHLVIHSSHGVRVNRAWGLAIRKRFCRNFNFELQAAATEDAILLSLGPTHSFELSTIGDYLRSQSARDVLTQALLDAPMFEIRWRHNTARSLANPRFAGGKKVPAFLARIRADDLLATAFPDQQACLENIVGEREIPDHPLVTQTLSDCLNGAMNADAFVNLLRRREAGWLPFVYRDLSEPSPLAQEILNANPYAFLDPAPLEERRTQAVLTRRFVDPKTASDLGQLDPGAIERVREQAWPSANNPDELSDALSLASFVRDSEAETHYRREDLDALLAEGRATVVITRSGLRLWCSAEQLVALLTLLSHVRLEPRFEPTLRLPPLLQSSLTPEAAAQQIVRARLECLGPQTLAELVNALSVDQTCASARRLSLAFEHALLHLETSGAIMAGDFDSKEEHKQWCDRSLLARIHRYTLQRLRREVESVDGATFCRFLLTWQHVGADARLSGPDAVATVISQLEGFEAAALAWEQSLLPARIDNYMAQDLDNLCHSGRIVWARLSTSNAPRATRSVATTPIVLSTRESMTWLGEERPIRSVDSLSSSARSVLSVLQQRGASFLVEFSKVLPTQTEVELALSELVAAGFVSSDSFSGMRGLLPQARRTQRPGRRRTHPRNAGLESAGRWTLIHPCKKNPESQEGNKGTAPARSSLERWARLLLQRYGVVFRAILDRENAPPWRDLLREYRRLEARGEIRGGRFVARMSGEQFALPDAIPLLRRRRNDERLGREVLVSACDPLNLVGSVFPGKRVAASPSNSLLFRDGTLYAVLEAGKASFPRELPLPEQQRLTARLQQGAVEPRKP